MIHIYGGKIPSKLRLYSCIWGKQSKLDKSLPKVDTKAFNKDEKNTTAAGGYSSTHVIIAHDQSLKYKGIEKAEVKNKDFED